ncbi:MAG: hypothetical protein LUD68_07375, partial [Rikenellaceae bacterium]|nr:hypothetical protein [Rikenellaceae bacterium]
MMMRKLIYIAGLLLLTACRRDFPSEPAASAPVVIDLIPGNSRSRIVDAENLASEQYIANVSVFLTDPRGMEFTRIFIHPSIVTIGDTTRITLPVESAQLPRGDLYVVANHDDTEALGAVGTVPELLALETPVAGPDDNLDPSAGICMYGLLSDFDFSDDQAYPAVVPLERTCCKYRITLTFPDAAGISTVNAFFIANAARYAFIGGLRAGNAAVDDYYDYSQRIDLSWDENRQSFTNQTYVYESFAVPVFSVFIEVDGQEQGYTGNLPVPEPNYLL